MTPSNRTKRDPLTEPAPPGLRIPALVPGGWLDRELLVGFAAQARAQGQRALPHRMRYDRRYALHCLGRAHAFGDAALRELAMRLFAVYLVADRTAAAG